MSQKKIEPWEVERYWEIFSGLANGATHLDGSQAASVLRNSQLSESQLDKIWQLADIDNDGRLDFEEFCVAMRLIFDLVNGEMKSIPAQVPDWLVPSSKTDLVQASRALSGSLPRFEQVDDDDEDDGLGLKDGFDWYMPPGDKAKYEEIYNAHSNSRGDVEFTSLQGLYDSLDVPDTDVRSAWNLVNPKSDQAIGKSATLAYLHILNNRHEGFRIPRTVPPSLRSSFERNNIDYQVDRVPSPAARGNRYDDNTTTGRKAKFGDTYLSRLGLGGSASSYSKKTDFGGKEDADWEEVRLKKQLAKMDAKMKRVEEQAEAKRRRRAGGQRESKPALVKRELEQLLDWKRKELRDLELGEGRAKEGENMKSLRGEVDSVREQVEGLERHWKERQKVLDGLKDEVSAAQRS